MPSDPGRIRGEIAFRDLGFRYDASRRCCINSTDDPGRETLAIVGHTGARKSTLGKLITRFTSSRRVSS